MQRRNFIRMAAATGLAGSLSCSSDDSPETGKVSPPPDPKAIHARILTLDSHDDIQEEFIEHGLDLGARYITLTHMGLNQLGDSSNDHKCIPARMYGWLNDFVKAVILEMNRLGRSVPMSPWSS